MIVAAAQFQAVQALHLRIGLGWGGHKLKAVLVLTSCKANQWPGSREGAILSL
jgi:hypothetical protein